MRHGWLLLWVCACSDYNLKPGDDVEPPDESEPPPPEPDVEVSPTEVDLGAVCLAGQSTVQVQNVGEADLNVISVSTTGEGWSAEAELPAVVAPGSSLPVIVMGSDGDGSLIVETDDPDEPTVEVPLYAVADQPPTVEIVAPAADAVLESGDLTLMATVWDDVDSPDALGLSWTSSADGLISTDPAASDGSAVATWADGRTEGPHLVTLTATDSCGNTASDEASVCQQGGYLVDELDLDDWNFEGAATWDTTNNWLQLTEPLTDQVGTAFEISETVTGGNVEIEFLFYVSGGTGADGISLTAIDADRMTTFLGGTGCGIGYGGDAACTEGPALPGWSIEVDTWYNEESDPTSEDHVAFTFDGDVDDPAAWAALPDMEDGAWHTMNVSVVEPHITITIDGTAYIDQDLSGTFSFPAYVGFTGGTGGMTNYHLIDSLTVTEYVCE